MRSVEPAVRLIPVRHLRRVINYLLDHDFRVPTNTELPFWVTREILDKSQLLPATVLEGSDSRILLITDPGDRMIDHLPREEQLRIYWRILFRAAVIAEFDRNYGGGLVAQDGTLRELPPRLDQFGAAAAREIEFVLASEHCVQPGQSALATFAMFASVYLDLSVFERHAVELFFPSAPIADVDRVLRTVFDVPALLARTRPPGAADPLREPPPDENPLVEPHSPALSLPEEPQNALLLKAREAEE
ncbi:MAG TPA: hypothetical protein VLM40_01265, partial [Gemmata sp.]|nr:hypothetical protein [Gemmata sp.]